MDFDFSVVSVPFRMQPGLRRVAPGAAQLTPSWPGNRYQREKMAVLASFPAQALCAAAGFDAEPALRAIAAEAAGIEPVAWRCDDAANCSAPALGWSLIDGEPSGSGDAAIGVVLGALPRRCRPAALLSLAFDEDFAVVEATAGTIPWLAICLPSRWAPEHKLGLPFAAVHAPVADNAVLLAASESLVRLVVAGERWERFVWTFSADPRLHQHPARGHGEWPAGDIAEAAWLRSERQTFIPVPGVGQAVFTIRIESEPIALAVAAPEDAARLHAALLSMTPAVLAYRGLQPARDRLLRWLERQAADAKAHAP